MPIPKPYPFIMPNLKMRLAYECTLPRSENPGYAYARVGPGGIAPPMEFVVSPCEFFSNGDVRTCARIVIFDA